MKKEHEIIMLPSEKPSELKVLDGELFLGKKELGHFGAKPQHLYILSDEEIKEGDWYYNELDKAVRKNNTINHSYHKKIIATINPELIKEGVASIHEDIIKAYVKKQFDKVMVEYAHGTHSVGRLAGHLNGKKILWVNKDGTLDVSLIEENELNVYLKSRDRILSSQANDSQSLIQHQLEARNRLAEVRQISKWIKENE